MAMNLRAKLRPEDTLLVYDVNEASTEKFVKENDATSAGTVGESRSKSTVVEAVGSAREAAERSVSLKLCYMLA